ncbi:MAG: hypothetical protein AUK47_14760 [Deltaproteobacteria bacterium CG2_30_63_29]|nr:MAG: hypothetical protein AUK47_14760 [Deltaproteobacteria bacterium CG2_30_63_29]PIV98497.1 MAG: hypothetical protein COW42_14335 [Deltaproteobacteria bacterium CG17_big_fil_post_rev_8_21_14_2_50_63_7]PJB42851.1 MAG: hypothetical protein CO108_11015 [Deltaproteobacteria bacterium CG_4_9_14_3_um_filter_63_12]
MGVQLEGLLRVERSDDSIALVFTGKVESAQETACRALLTLQDLNEINLRERTTSRSSSTSFAAPKPFRSTLWR